jgi:hypothetical protein
MFMQALKYFRACFSVPLRTLGNMAWL